MKKCISTRLERCVARFEVQALHSPKIQRRFSQSALTPKKNDALTR